MNTFFLKDREILHNTRDGSEFYVPYVSQATCNFRERAWALGRVGEEEEESQGSTPVYYEACLKT